MKNKRLLVKRSQFCEQINEWLTEKLRQALNAEEVILTNGEFLIIEDYDVVESYYGYQLIQPIGGKISMLDGIRIILNSRANKEDSVLHQPNYSEVLITLTSKEIHKCFIVYEVLCTHANKLTDIMATKYLKHIASSHHWDYDTFIDIIDEEYTCIYNK